MGPDKKRDKTKRLICLCNAVSQAEIEAAIERGCRTLGRIFDATTAGVGACGGTCQPILRKMLETYEKEGVFPEYPRTGLRKRRPRR
jgi:bacterioferritin-associated ferredoxin